MDEPSSLCYLLQAPLQRNYNILRYYNFLFDPLRILFFLQIRRIGVFWRNISSMCLGENSGKLQLNLVTSSIFFFIVNIIIS